MQYISLCDVFLNKYVNVIYHILYIYIYIYIYGYIGIYAYTNPIYLCITNINIKVKHIIICFLIELHLFIRI